MQERPQWNFWSFFYFVPIFPICCMWTKIDKNYIVLYFFLPFPAFSSRNNLCKNLVGVLCFLLFKAKYKRNGLSPLFHKINGAGHLSLIWIQSDLLNVIVNLYVSCATVAQSAFCVKWTMEITRTVVWCIPAPFFSFSFFFSLLFLFCFCFLLEAGAFWSFITDKKKAKNWEKIVSGLIFLTRFTT